MNKLMMLISHISKFLRMIGAVILTGMMFLTVADVILRYLGRPILGSYELVAMAGALVIGFILPQNSLADQNVCVDSFVNTTPKLARKIFMISRRILGLALFILLAYGMFRKGVELNEAAEVSNVLHIPLSVLAYGLAGCSFVQILVLVCLFVNAFCGGEGNDE